jgi:indolepyruvate ferredoxin oxidoreductase beta subunit
VSTVRPIRIAIAAMGGQGGGVLADWIVDLAEHAGHFAQSTSVPGVAQRTGATVYYLELFPRDAAGGRTPVLALMPVPGDVDIVIAGELVEAGRAVLRGLVTPELTTLIASSHRDYALSEKMAMGDGRVDVERLRDGIERAAKRCIAFDMAAIADSTGSVISAVLFGALAGSGTLPFSREQFEDTIRRGGVGVEASLRAFAAGHDGAATARRGSAPPSPPAASAPDPVVARRLDQCRLRYPAPVLEVLRHALPRLAAYQDHAYVEEYLALLEPVAGLDHRDGAPLACETARHLALWMTYEDTIRVAQMKIQPERLERIRAEARAKPDQIVHVVEFLHPRVEEICDTLPAPLGRWVLGNAAARRVLGYFCRHGRRIRTTGLPGFLLLYSLSLLRPWRRRLLRHGRETDAIRAWLARIAEAATSDYDLAMEVARSQRLVKGYGDTHARGLGNFTRIMERLPAIRAAPQPSARLRELCDAALADEHGTALTAALEQRA